MKLFVFSVQPKEEMVIFFLSMTVLQTYIIVKQWEETEPMWSTVAILIQTNVLCNICSTLSLKGIVSYFDYQETGLF